MAEDFTHFNDQGRARMVDVGEKTPTSRTAVAAGRVLVNRETFDLIRSGGVDFVVTRRNPLPNRLLNDSSYELVAQSNFFFSTRYYDYYLYRLKESP